MACQCNCCSGACCYEFAGSPICTYETCADCEDLDGEWQGPGTECTGANTDECPCDPPADHTECEKCVSGTPTARCAGGENCCDGVCQEEACCPAYPVTVYITGGIEFAGGYRSLEIQAVDANGTRVYDWRGSNGVFIFTGSSAFANGEADGCDPVEVHVFTDSTDPAETIVSLANGDFSHTVDPATFECCAAFGGGGAWCDNPQGACEDDPP